MFRSVKCHFTMLKWHSTERKHLSLLVIGFHRKRLAQRVVDELHLRRSVRPHLVRGDQGAQLAAQRGVEINPLVQFAESRLRAESRAIDLGEFRPPVSTYFKVFHILGISVSLSRKYTENSSHTGIPEQQ